MMITLNEVRRALEQIVVASPEKKNPGCIYTDRFDNHCVVGEVVLKLGGRVPAFGSPQSTTGISVLISRFNLGIQFSGEALRYLEALQSFADARPITWAAAMVEADKRCMIGVWGGPQNSLINAGPEGTETPNAI